MDNRDENASGGRVTRSRIRRGSIESDSSSRPGTPVVQPSAKLPAINETTDGSNTPTIPVRLTRRNSTTLANMVAELPKTPAKIRAAVRAQTPEVYTPSKRTTRRRVTSITEEDSEVNLTKKDSNFDALKEEDPSKIIKEEQHSPIADENQTNKRVTRSSSKSPNDNAESPVKLSKIGDTRRKSANVSKILDITNDSENKELKGINLQSNDIKNEKMVDSVIEIFDDDSVQDEAMQVDAPTVANDSNADKKIQSFVPTKVAENVSGDNDGNAKTNDKVDGEQNSSVITLPSKGTTPQKGTEINIIDLEKQDSEIMKQQMPQTSVNPVIVDESTKESTPVVDKLTNKSASPQITVAKRSLNDINTTTPTQSKRNFSGNFKSVGFNDSVEEDTPKSIYPKTPSHTKTKSFIEIDSSQDEKSFLESDGANNSFESSGADRNILKEDSEVIIPETQQAEAEKQIDKDVSNAEQRKPEVVDTDAAAEKSETPLKKLSKLQSIDSSTPIVDAAADAEKSEANRTPLKKLKKLQSIESSTPIANSTAQVKKPSQDLTPVQKVEKVNATSGLSTEKSLRSARSYTLTSNEQSKNEKLEKSKHQESVEKTDKSLANKSFSETDESSKDISLKNTKGKNVKETIFNKETWSEGVTGTVSKDSKIDDIAKSATSVTDAKVTEIVEEKKEKSSKRSSLSFLAEDDNDEEQFSVRDDDDPAATEEEELAEDEKAYKRHPFVDDEAMEVDENYESGDSLDEEERKEMIENEVPIDGESIGSKDTDDDYEDEEFEKNSFIVTDSEDELLQYSDDDEHLNESKEKKSREKKKFKRIVLDDSTTDVEIEKKAEENEAELSTSNKLKNTKSSQILDAVLDKEIEKNKAGDIVTETVKDIVTDEFMSELEKDVECMSVPPKKTSKAQKENVEDGCKQQSPKATTKTNVLVTDKKTSEAITHKSPEEQFAPSGEHSSLDSDVSKLSETALKLCYTAGEDPTEESSDDESKVNKLNASRKDILRKINNSERFNKTNHELDVEHLETSTEIEQLCVSTEKIGAKANRKYLNRSKIEAIRESQVSSEDDDDDVAKMNENKINNDKSKRKSPNVSKMENLDDGNKDTNTDKSFSNNDTNKSKKEPLLHDKSAKKEEIEKAFSITSAQTSPRKRKTRNSCNVQEANNSNDNNGNGESTSAKKLTKKSLRKSLNENQLLGKEGEKSVGASLIPIKPQRKSLNESLINSKKASKRNPLDETKEIKLQVESSDEEVTNEQSYDADKSIFPTVSHLGDVSVTDSDDNESDVNDLTDEAKNNGIENNELAEVTNKEKKIKSAGLSLSFGECLQTKKKSNKGKTVLHNSYTIGVSVYGKSNNKNEVENKHEADEEDGQSFHDAEHTSDVDNMEVSYGTTDYNESSNVAKVQLNSDEEQELKKLDHIQKLFNPLLKTRRQSLAMSQNEQITTDKQSKRSKRQTLNIPSAKDFNPSQSLIDTIAMCKNTAADSPKAQNSKRKRLSKSFNGIGSLDPTESEESHHLHKKTKLVAVECGETAQQADGDNALHTSEILNKFTEIISSTPCIKKSDNESNIVKRILSRCDQILEAASRAKLESKQNFLKSKVKISNKLKKAAAKASKQTDLPESHEGENDDDAGDEAVTANNHVEPVEELSDVVKKAVMASAKILHFTGKNLKEVGLSKNIEAKNEKRRLPVDVIEAISYDAQPKAAGPVKTKKIRKPKQESPKSDQENVEHVQKSSAGYVVETLLTPKKVKKLKPIETINLPTGKMNVLPVTPKKRFINGFNETDATPQTIGFKVRQILNHGQDVAPAMSMGKNKKRKRQQLAEEPKYSLPQPKWTQSGKFIEEDLSVVEQQPYHLLAQHKTAGTDFMFASLEPNNNKRTARKIKKVARSNDLYENTSVSAINANALNFKNAATRHVVRESSRAILHRKERCMVNNKF